MIIKASQMRTANCRLEIARHIVPTEREIDLAFASLIEGGDEHHYHWHTLIRAPEYPALNRKARRKGGRA